MKSTLICVGLLLSGLSVGQSFNTVFRSVDTGERIAYRSAVIYKTVCFEGSAWSARKELSDYLANDGEIFSTWVYFHQGDRRTNRDDQIEFHLISKKCLDDNFMNTIGDCTTNDFINRCQ
jgi:hypothetical protein